MKIVVSPRAREDLRGIYGHIARVNQAAANGVIDRLDDAIALLAAEKIDGREVVLQDGRSVRVWLVSSYRVYYRRVAAELHIVRVYHQARRPIER